MGSTIATSTPARPTGRGEETDRSRSSPMTPFGTVPDPRATLLVESGETYAELKSAILYCDVEILTDPDEIAQGMALVRADAQLSGSLSTDMSDQVRASMAKRVILRCTPFRTVSWDHAKLGAFY